MKRLRIIFFCALVAKAPTLHSSSLPYIIANDCIDTLKTGIPIALFSGILWHIAYRVPHDWPDVTEPTASFIYNTWKQQGFKQADTVLLKRIPNDSFMAKVVVYTQELPGALAVGLPFIKRVEHLLTKKTQIKNSLALTTDASTIQTLHAQYTLLEQELNECRFVCGHERVHQERHHAYKLLLTQSCAPFLVYMVSKHGAQMLNHYNILPVVATLLQWKIFRSTTEIFIFWLKAHLYERDADLHASTDPQVIKAGIKLFKRAQQQKVPEMGPVGYRVKLMSWLLKYTHPVLQERIWYLSMALKKLHYTSSDSPSSQTKDGDFVMPNDHQ